MWRHCRSLAGASRWPRSVSPERCTCLLHDRVGCPLIAMIIAPRLCGTQDGFNALFYACGAGNMEAALYLVNECGLNPAMQAAVCFFVPHFKTSRDSVNSTILSLARYCAVQNGMTCLHFACLQDRPEMANWLVKSYPALVPCRREAVRCKRRVGSIFIGHSNRACCCYVRAGPVDGAASLWSGWLHRMLHNFETSVRAHCPAVQGTTDCVT